MSISESATQIGTQGKNYLSTKWLTWFRVSCHPRQVRSTWNFQVHCKCSSSSILRWQRKSLFANRRRARHNPLLLLFTPTRRAHLFSGYHDHKPRARAKREVGAKTRRSIRTFSSSPIIPIVVGWKFTIHNMYTALGHFLFWYSHRHCGSIISFQSRKCFPTRSCTGHQHFGFLDQDRFLPFVSQQAVFPGLMQMDHPARFWLLRKAEIRESPSVGSNSIPFVFYATKMSDLDSLFLSLSPSLNACRVLTEDRVSSHDDNENDDGLDQSPLLPTPTCCPIYPSWRNFSSVLKGHCHQTKCLPRKSEMWK